MHTAPPPEAQPYKTRPRQHYGALTTTFAMLALLLAGCPASEPIEEPIPPEFANVDRMWQMYNENEVKADLAFRGKRVRIVGAVVEISNGMFGNEAVIQLVGEVPNHRARASMKKAARASAADLKKGQQVALLCIGNSVVLGSPQLQECTID